MVINYGVSCYKNITLKNKFSKIEKKQNLVYLKCRSLKPWMIYNSF